MALNEDQQKAREAIANFLLGPEREFILEGAAGTGKSFLLKNIVDDLLPSMSSTASHLGQPTHRYTYCATTNKAAALLGTKTIHSLLELVVKTDYQTGSTRLVHKNPSEPVRIYDTLVIIDEYSMLDSQLDRFINDCLVNCHILYVGDSKQLPPVMGINPVEQRVTNRYRLTKQMRANNPELGDLICELDDAVTYERPALIQLVKDKVTYLDKTQIQDKIKEVFDTDPLNSRIITYTNEVDNKLNKLVRANRGFTSVFEAGEIVINKSHVTSPTISASTELEVLAIGSISKRDGVTYMNLRLRPLGSSHVLFVDTPLYPMAFNERLKQLSKDKNWTLYYRLKERIAVLSHGYAQTAHTAQGSTFDNVFVDLTDLSRCRNKDVARRLLYVAISRAREKVYLYNTLDPRIGRIL